MIYGQPEDGQLASQVGNMRWTDLLSVGYPQSYSTQQRYRLPCPQITFACRSRRSLGARAHGGRWIPSVAASLRRWVVYLHPLCGHRSHGAAMHGMSRLLSSTAAGGAAVQDGRLPPRLSIASTWGDCVMPPLVSQQALKLGKTRIVGVGPHLSGLPQHPPPCTVGVWGSTNGQRKSAIVYVCELCRWPVR